MVQEYCCTKKMWFNTRISGLIVCREQVNCMRELNCVYSTSYPYTSSYPYILLVIHIYF